jgi:small-conductance mechanosensitive channel
MTADAKKSSPRWYWGGFLIIAGLLIGFGVGLLTGYPGSGFLIGTGLGFLGATFINPVERVDRVAIVQVSTPRSRYMVALTGIVLVVFGLGIVLALWPYIIAVLIILAGFFVLFHGFAKPYYISLKK